MPIDLSSAYQLLGEQPEPEKLDRPGQFGKGFKSGIDQTQAMGSGLVAAFGDALGIDSLKEWGLSSYHKNMQEADANRANVQGFTDIEGIGDAIDWALYTAGNMAPMLATSLLSGGVGAIAAKKLASSAAQKIISAELAKGVALDVAKKTAAKHIAKAGSVGAGTGAYASSAGMEVGSIYGESPDVEGRTGTAFAHGAVAGALDVLPQMRILKRLGIGRVAGDEIQDSVMKFAGKQIASEGVTEGLQTIVEQHAQYWLDENKGMFKPHHWKQIIDASAAGGLMGGLSGGASGLVNRPSNKTETKVTAPPVVEPLQLPKPDPTAYVDPQGQTQYGPSQPFVSPQNDPNFVMSGMETEVARGEPAPLEGVVQSGQKQPKKEVAKIPGETFDVTPEREALPKPGTIVVDKEGVAKKGPTAPFVPEQPQGGKGMDKQAPTAKKSTDKYQLSYKTNGKPFTTEQSAKLSKSFRDAKKADENPKVVSSGDGFAVQVEKVTRHEMRPQPTSKEISTAAHEASTSPKNDLPEPSQAEIEADNYKKGHLKLHGIDISVENPKGSLRKGVSPEGDAWSSKLHSHYGDIKRTTGADGDAVDVFIGENPDSDQVFIVDQVNKDGSFDEHKTLIGFSDEQSARDNYLKNYEKGWTGLGAMTQMSVDEFKTWLKDGNTKKPLALKETKITEVPDAKVKEKPKKDAEEVSGKEDTKAEDKVLKPTLTIEEHSAKAIIVKGDIEALKPRLRKLGGIWNANGWIFAKKKESEVRKELAGLLEQVESPKPAVEAVSVPKKEEKAKPKTRKADAKADSISKAEAEKVVNKVTFSWAGGKKNVVLVDTFDDLPSKVKADFKEQNIGDGDVNGAFDGGKIYLVRDVHDTVESLEQTIFHESYGHYGLKSLFGKGIQKKMLAVYLAIGGSKGLVRYAEKHNYELSSYAKGLLNDGSITRDQAYAILTEELLAHMAGNAKPSLKSKVMELIGFIRQWLRDHGFKAFEKYNESDLMSLLKRSRQEVKGKTKDVKQDEDTGTRFSIHHASEAFDDLDQVQKDAFKKIGPKTIPQRVNDRIAQVADRIGLKVKQGLVDKVAAFQELDKKARGENVVEQDTANSSWVLARMSRAAGGALNALISHGRIFMDNGIIDVDTNSDSLMDVLKKLGGSAEVERFMGWIAGNRSKVLMAEGKENLFSEDEINALIRANSGTMKDGRDRASVYKDTFKEFQVIQNDVLKIAEKSGIISNETRDLWKNEFYVPFYRVMDDADISGPQTMGGGLSRQYAYKKLKGGGQNLNDLLENTMMNFEHLISASLKNQAASKAIENAEMVDVATKTTEKARDKNTSTFVLENGEKVWYDIADPLVFQALTSMADVGMNSTAMNVMRSFKRVFTSFVTASPQFMVANLIRDSFQAVALADMKKNPIANVIGGINSYGVFDKSKEGRAHLQATGGSFSFGHAYGEDTESMKIELNRMLRTGTIIEDSKDVLALLKKGWDSYRSVSDSLENVNRAAVYDKAIADGKTKLQAAFEARDLMDFSSHGAWPAIRFLVAVVPFLNARLQGLDKIYRSGVKPSGSVIRSMFPGADPATDTDKKAAARFAAVTGALTIATLALYLSNKDDEDYKKLEDWQKDTYWFMKVGDSAFFLPKPFEVGAIATLAERTLEQLVDDKATGKLFAERLGHMLSDTFSFNPTPQLFRPIIDIYANKDSFTGRQIETMGQKRLSPSLRTRAGTSGLAKVVSAVTEETFGTLLGDDSSLVLSPVQIDYLIGGWLGWLGETAVATTDVAVKAMTGKEDPAKSWSEYQPFRRFYRDLSLPGYTKYQTEFYDNLREVSRIHADIKQYREAGEFEAARDLAIKNRSKLNLRLAMNRIQKRLSKLGNQAKIIKNSNASAEIKRRRLDMIQATKNKLTEMMAKRYKD